MNTTLRTTGFTLLRRWAGVLLAISLVALAADVYANNAGSMGIC